MLNHFSNRPSALLVNLSAQFAILQTLGTHGLASRGWDCTHRSCVCSLVKLLFHCQRSRRQRRNVALRHHLLGKRTVYFLPSCCTPEAMALSTTTARKDLSVRLGPVPQCHDYWTFTVVGAGYVQCIAGIHFCVLKHNSELDRIALYLCSECCLSQRAISLLQAH